MADFNALQALINAYIKKNGVKAITGQILNGVLSGMVSALGKGYTVAGEASPETDPGTMTGPVAYIAHTAGTYEHFGNLVVEQGEVAMLIFDENTWTKNVIASLSAEATVDDNIGTPGVDVSFVDGVLTFNFRNLKGDPGENGQDGQDGRDGVDGQNGQDGAAAGFGTVTASVDANVGTPGVTVQTSGPNTAKNFAFQFTNLKGETGVTSCVVTVDNTSGNPACAVSLVGQVLHLDFTGLKGAQGNTGSSVDYPFTIVNNLTTDDAAQALSAAQGVVLQGEIHELDIAVNGVPSGEKKEIVYNRADGETWYLNSSGLFVYSDERLGIWLPITPHKSYTVVGDETSSVVIAILEERPKTSTHTSKTAHYATGYSDRIVLSAGEDFTFVAPNDAEYIFLSLKTPADVYPKLYKALVAELGLEGRVEELETQTTFDKDVLVSHGYYLKVADGTVAAAASFSTSDYINVRGAFRIRLPYAGETSSATPIAFYDRNKVLIYAKTNLFNSFDLFDIDVPDGAKYIRVCVQNTIPEWSLSIYGQVQVSEVDFGIFPNPFVEVGGFNRKTIVSTADAPSGLPVVRCAGSIAKNGNIVYTIATCTPGGADSGKRKSVFKAYNVSTDEAVATNVVFDGGNGAYMNEVVFYDANGVLGTAGTLYAFAIYHADYTKLYINETDPNDLDFVYKTSTDGGETWSEETSLKSLLPDGFLSLGCSPANPIVLANGTFCLAGFFMKDEGTGVSKYRSGLITKKNGYNWKAIPLDIDETNVGENETTIVEYGNNSVMLNVRSNYDVYSRAIYYTSEIIPGEDFVFHRHPSWRTMLVPDSHLCEGSITKFGGLYYYSSVDFTMKPDQTRQNILLYVSPDACKWYPLLYLFIGTTKGYSHLLTQGNNLYVMFESENSTIDYADITTRVNALLSGGMSTIISHTPDWRLLEVAKNREGLNQ